MGFCHLVGNEAVKNRLQTAVNQKKVTHSYLFLGPSGIGKTLFAKEFAKMILCLEEENKPCNKCKSCLSFQENNQPDFIFIQPEDGTIKIEKIRAMQEKILEKPILSGRKIYVIQDADTMTKEAQNCLLKTLEEPPSYITIVLVASNESKLLSTIRSRCMKIAFQKLSQEELQTALQQMQVEDIPQSLYPMFEGSIQKAQRILERRQTYEEIQEIFSHVERYHLLDVINRMDCLYKNKEIMDDILDYIMVLFSQKMVQDSKYIQYIETINQVKNNLKANSNFDMNIDQLLFTIWEE